MVDATARRVALASGDAIEYDRLVLSPGVSFVAGAIEGFDAVGARAMPHAYGGGFQNFLLKKRIAAVPEGGLFVIAPPAEPYRCPAAPYERASMVANYFMRENRRAKVLVLDAKDSFEKQAAFTRLWSEFYGDMIEWTPASLSGGGVQRIEPESGVVETGRGDRIRADAASIIPPQQAAGVAFNSGLSDDDGWVTVDAASMRAQRDPSIYVIGDAARGGDMLKTASAANSQAQLCAAALQADLLGSAPSSSPLEETVWSFVDSHDAIMSQTEYAAQDGSIRAVARSESSPEDDEKKRLDNALAANGWYVEATADMFG